MSRAPAGSLSLKLLTARKSTLAARLAGFSSFDSFSAKRALPRARHDLSALRIPDCSWHDPARFMRVNARQRCGKDDRKSKASTCQRLLWQAILLLEGRCQMTWPGEAHKTHVT